VALQRTRHLRRRFLRSGLALAGLGLLSGCGALPVPGQPPPKVPRVGYLTQTNTAVAEIEAFRDGLRELGYVEGQNIAIEVRRSESAAQSQSLLAELVALPVDLILTAAGPADTLAAMAATRTIPIIFPASPDPVLTGLVGSLARPGGNVTGLSSLGPQANGKRLELLLEIKPGISRVMFVNRDSAPPTGALPQAQQAARALGVQLLALSIPTAADLPAAFQMAIDDRAEALWMTSSPLLNGEVARIMEFATGQRLPVLSQTRIFVDTGGLLYYGPNRLALFRRSATYVDRILKGAKPGDLPVEQPTTFDFIINKKTADALGLTIPQSVLQQATEIIQ
jgi:putative tryptophan/tyrosine transport system substrate-binding protein